MKNYSKCKHSETMLVRGKWGPHRAKRICMDCGVYIKWERTKKVDKHQKDVILT